MGVYQKLCVRSSSFPSKPDNLSTCHTETTISFKLNLPVYTRGSLHWEFARYWERL